MDIVLSDSMLRNFRMICDKYDSSIKIEILDNHQALLVRLWDLIQPMGTLDEFLDSFPIHEDLIWCAIPPMHTVMITKFMTEQKFVGYKNFIVDWYNILNKTISDDGILYISFLHEIAHLLHPNWSGNVQEEAMCNEWAVDEYNNNVLTFVKGIV